VNGSDVILKIGYRMLKKPDFSALQGKSLNEVSDYADSLANGEVEDRINAHSIYTSILEQLPSSGDKSVALARTFLTKKIWNLEKSFFWNGQYFSEAGQDKRIKDAFFRNCRNGFFLEIGAFDGVTGSNCLHFEKFMGWDGVAVEPSRTQYDYLRKNRRCRTVNKAVGFLDQTVTFIDVVQGLQMMSGVDSDAFANTKSLIEKDEASQTETYQVETISVMEMVDGRKEVDFMSLDIEGEEIRVLESIDFEALRIRVIAVENAVVGSSKFRDFLYDVGYRYYDTIGIDEIYFHPESVQFTRE